MPRLRIGADITDMNLHGSVWDSADLLAALARTNLRSFVPGPWGEGDEALAAEIARRTNTAPCDQQCFITAHSDGALMKTGCGCASGWQYASDEDVQTLEGCKPQDVWNDARGLILNHVKVGRGDADPILCDCDDLTAICAASAKYQMWKSAGSPTTFGGRPRDVGEVQVAITRPKGKNMAHAYMLSSTKPVEGEPQIRLQGLWVFDPAARWGMTRPPESFYGDGEVAVYPLRFSDL